MNEDAEIRKELERALGRLPDAVWDDLVESEFVGMHLEGHLEPEDQEKSFGILKEEAQKRVRLVERGVSEALKEMRLAKGDTNDEDSDGEWRWVPYRASLDEPSKDQTMLEAYFDLLFLVGPKSAAMLRATSAYFGWLCGQHPGVLDFRNRVLEGSTLTLYEARRLMASYAARFFPLEWFLNWDIPVVDHVSEIVGEYDWGTHRDDIDHRVTVRVDPPGIIERVRYAHPEAPILDEDPARVSTRCVLMKKSRGALLPYSVELPEDPEEKPTSIPPPMLLSSHETPSRPLAVWPGSVVGDLYVLAEQLADAFCWPGKDAAAEFVLTGSAPLMRPIDARVYEEGGHLNSPVRIRLDVSPWVSENEVSRSYRELQERVVEGRNRLPEPKTLKLTSFVWEKKRRFGYDRIPWTKLYKRWNRENSDSQFKSHSNFRTYFLRGDKAVKEFNFSRFMFDKEESPDK